MPYSKKLLTSLREKGQLLRRDCRCISVKASGRWHLRIGRSDLSTAMRIF